MLIINLCYETEMLVKIPKKEQIEECNGSCIGAFFFALPAMF